MKTDSFYLWINRETRAACLSACFDTHLLLPKKLYAYTNKLQRDWNQKALAFCYRLRNHLYSQVYLYMHPLQLCHFYHPSQSDTSASENECGKFAIVDYGGGRPTLFIKQWVLSSPSQLISSANNRFSSAERNSEISPAGTLSSCSYKI